MQNQVVMARRSKTAVWCVCAMAAWIAFASLTAPAVHAVTLSNRDSETYKIEVIAKSTRRALEIAPGKSMTDFCPQGCVIRLNNSSDNDYELEGTERVSIEGGLVYYDGEEVKKTDGAQNK